jgi:ubiquinone/menaquinone biosynthesis C-methylase UbiE
VTTRKGKRHSSGVLRCLAVDHCQGHDWDSVTQSQGQSGASSPFDRAAPSYGRIGTDFFSDLGQSLVSQTRILPGDLVLDVGAGTGAVTLPAANQSGPRGGVVAIDVSEPMLRRLLASDPNPGCAPVISVLMDATRLGLRDESHDVILCGLVLSALPFPEIALHEMCRVLRPGGRLGMSVAPGWWWQEDTRWSWHADLVNELDVQVTHTPSSGRRFVQGLLDGAPCDEVQVVEECRAIRWKSWTEFWTLGAGATDGDKYWKD